MTIERLHLRATSLNICTNIIRSYVYLTQYQYFIFKYTHGKQPLLMLLFNTCAKMVCHIKMGLLPPADIFLVFLSRQSVSWLSVGKFPLCVRPLYASLWSQRQRHLHWWRTRGGFQHRYDTLTPHLIFLMLTVCLHLSVKKPIIICLSWQHAGTNGCTLSNFQIAAHTYRGL